MSALTAATTRATPMPVTAITPVPSPPRTRAMRAVWTRAVLQVACGKCSERRWLAAKALSFCPGRPCLVAAVNRAQDKCFSAINPCGVAVCIRTQCGME